MVGRKPFIVNTTLPGGRSAVHDHSQDAIREAIVRSEVALGPAHALRRFETVCDLEDGRSFELYWEAQATRVRLAARERDDGTPSLRTRVVQLVHGFQVSAERSTAC